MLPFLRLAAGLASRSAQARAGDTARRIVLSLVAGMFALVGAGFLTAAGWLALAWPLGAIGASLVVGGVFLLLALILLLAAGARRRSPVETEMQALKAQAQALASRVPEEVAKAPALPLMGAFVGGLLLALRLRR